MSRIWFSSDWHIGDANVAAFRGISVEENTANILDFWAANVHKDDQIFFLGDLSIRDVPGALRAIKPLPGTKHIIAGNHDPVHPCLSKDSHKHYRKFADVFDSVQTFARRKIAGQEVWLSHFPFREDHSDPPRHMNYRVIDFGQWLMHGHTHKADQGLHDGREIHVGWDREARFYELNEIAQVIKDQMRMEVEQSSEEQAQIPQTVG